MNTSVIPNMVSEPEVRVIVFSLSRRFFSLLHFVVASGHSSSADSSPEQLVRRSHRLRRPPDCYSPLAFTATTLFKPASYHDDILNPA
jgi:hypothetical protein